MTAGGPSLRVGSILPWILSAGVGACGTAPAGSAPPSPQLRPPAADSPCRVVQAGERIEIHSPAFVLRLDQSDGLRAVEWENRITGRTLSLGNGPEVELVLDAAHLRIPITGWRCWRFENDSVEYADPAFRDAGWQGRRTPIPPQPDPGNEWARTHVFLPVEARGKPVRLSFGGFGVYDFRHSRAFVEGREVGARRALRRWNEPALIDIDPSLLRFGQDNVIALASTEEVTRTPRLDRLDPGQAWSISQKFSHIDPYEQYVIVGEPSRSPRLEVTSVRAGAGELVVALASPQARLEVEVAYAWTATEPVLRKKATIRNLGGEEIRVLRLELGEYATGAQVSDGDLGFPVYAEEEFFLGLAHPAGWAIGQEGVLRLRQVPGRLVPPGAALVSMEAVLGVGAAGAARSAFLAHLEGRMRRVARGHDRPYAIFESFGSWPSGDFFGVDEAHVLRQIETLAEETGRPGCRFDLYSIEFWHDSQGDFRRASPQRFPRGFGPVNAALEPLGMRLGLWYDTTQAWWSIGQNPVAHRALNYDPGYGTIDVAGYCRAAEPVAAMYSDAFAHHVRANGVRLFKLDGLMSTCYAPAHGHMLGVYSIEPTHDAAIRHLADADRASPEAFLMLYWGHRSPWWLLHADTLWDVGLQMEAASPAAAPTLFVRDSVIVGLDQARAWCEDVPPLGKDSLGTWLSSWPWNSSIGAERWQEAFLFDLCRGSLLAQPWSDEGFLTPPERAQMADFLALLRERASSFRRPRPILGDPWKHEPYGYSCSDGERAFIALNNCTWEDRKLLLALGPAWGLEGAEWDLYRWHPDPARIASPARTIWLRPFEIVLLEAVPPGSPPSLGRAFETRALPAAFDEPSRELELAAEPLDPASAAAVPLDAERGELPPKRLLVQRIRVPPCRSEAWVVSSAELSRGGRSLPLRNVGRHFAASARLDGAAIAAQPVVREWTYPAPWQAWRVQVQPSEAPRELVLEITARLPADADVASRARLVPRSR